MKDFILLLKRILGIVLPIFLVFIFILIPLLHSSHIINVENILQTYYTKSPLKQQIGSSSSKSPMNVYYNLSCPFEWSKYSCIHQDSFIKANLSLNYYLSMHKIDINQLFSKSLIKRRIFIVGDSLMRQIFIAIGCLGISSVKSYDVDWTKAWPCHNTKNCIESNEHSGFNLGRIEFINGNEVYFKPLGGSVSKVDEPHIVSRFIKELSTHGYISIGPMLSVPAKQLQMTSKDILVINLGVHDNGNINKIKYNELSVLGSKILSLQKTKNKANVPYFIYVSSPSQHFSDDGIFTSKANLALGSNSSSDCLSSVTHNIRNELEFTYLKINESVNSIVNYNDTNLGDMHIGNSDCTHYCLPGKNFINTITIIQ